MITVVTEFRNKKALRDIFPGHIPAEGIVRYKSIPGEIRRVNDNLPVMGLYIPFYPRTGYFRIERHPVFEFTRLNTHAAAHAFSCIHDKSPSPAGALCYLGHRLGLQKIEYPKARYYRASGEGYDAQFQEFPSRLIVRFINYFIFHFPSPP